jgi:hypothetical protein
MYDSPDSGPKSLCKVLTKSVETSFRGIPIDVPLFPDVGKRNLSVCPFCQRRTEAYRIRNDRLQTLLARYYDEPEWEFDGPYTLSPCCRTAWTKRRRTLRSDYREAIAGPERGRTVSAKNGRKL